MAFYTCRVFAFQISADSHPNPATRNFWPSRDGQQCAKNLPYEGCSSLGLLRYAVVVKFEQKKADINNTYLIDIKEATKTLAPRDTNSKMPRDNAARVVEGARQLAPHLGKRLVASRFMGRSVFLRELLPQDMKIELGQMSGDDAVIAARFLGRTVGRAHARQMDRATRLDWRRELVRNHTKTLDVPSWLWTRVVDLIGAH